MNFVSIILQKEVDSYQVIVTLFLVTTYFIFTREWIDPILHQKPTEILSLFFFIDDRSIDPLNSFQLIG